MTTYQTKNVRKYFGDTLDDLVQFSQEWDAQQIFGTYYFGAMLAAMAALRTLKKISTSNVKTFCNTKYEPDYHVVVSNLVDDSYPLRDNNKVQASTLNAIAHVAAKDDSVFDAIRKVSAVTKASPQLKRGDPIFVTVDNRIDAIIRNVCDLRLVE